VNGEPALKPINTFESIAVILYNKGGISFMEYNLEKCWCIKRWA